MNEFLNRLLLVKQVNTPNGTNIVNLISSTALVIAKADCSLLISSNPNGRIASYEHAYIPDSKNDMIEKMYIDDTGVNLIMTLTCGDSIYLNTLSLISKKLPKEMGLLVYVTFLKDNCILASNNKGNIFEIYVDLSGSPKFKYQLIYQIENSYILTSIYIEYLNLSSGENVAMMVFTTCCSQATRLYHSFSFDCNSSSILIQNLFKKTPPYIEFPTNLEQFNIEYSKLFVRQVSNEIVTLSIEFALISGNDIYHGFISAPCKANVDLVISANLIVNPSTAIQQDHQQACRPKLVFLTSHHLIVVNFANKIDIIHKLSNEKVIENYTCFEESAPTVGVRFDSKTQVIYMFTETLVHQISIANEDLMNIVIILSKTNLFKMFDFFSDTKHNRNSISNKVFSDSTTDNIALSHITNISDLSLDEMVLRMLNICPLAFELYIRDINTQINESIVHCNSALTFMLESQKTHQILKDFLTFLFSKMSSLIYDNTCQPQHTMIATWLFETYLHELVLKSINPEKSAMSYSTLVKDDCGNIKIAIENDENKEFIQKINTFLQNNRGVLDFHTTLKQFLERGNISSSCTNNNNGFSDLLLQYLKYTVDYDRLVYYLIQGGKYLEAIQCLKESTFDKKLEHLVYSWSHILIEKNPEAMLDMILSKKSYLKLEKLLPAWLEYCNLLKSDTMNAKQSGTAVPVNYAVRFVKEYFDGLMHDFSFSLHLKTFTTAFYSLIFILCKYDDSPDEKSLVLALSFDCDPVNGSLPLISNVLNAALLKNNFDNNESNYNDAFVTDYEDEFSPKSNPYIDYFYVLRLCQTYKKQKGIVYTYLILGMYTDAVEVALSYGNVNLAKSIAKRHIDKNTRRNLWIIIAKYTAELDKDNQKSHKILAVLRESENALHVQDIINMVPDFTEVSLFKEDICQQLETYSSVIDSLKVEMQELTESSHHISQEVEQGYKYSFAGHQKCEFCYESLFSQDEMYMFPCCHGYHVYCLLNRLRDPLLKYLDESQLVSLSKLEEQILYYSQSDVDNSNDNTQVHLEFLKNELDGYIAAECPLCGFYAINSLSTPLLNDYSESEKLSWSLSGS